MTKKLRSKCLRGRQRQLKQVHTGLPNAYQEGRSDRTFFSRTSASPRADGTPCGSLRSGWYRCVHDMYGPNGLNNSRSASPSSPAYVAAVGHEGIFSEASFSSSPKRSDAKYFERSRNTGKHKEGCTD